MRRVTDLELALQLADLADSITRPHFRAAGLKVETKPDLTPVSDADRAVEAAVRRHLAGTRPGDSVLGEEEGEDPGDSGRRWILDPIDGTRNFVRGVPVWATLIALEAGGRIEAGVVSAPGLGRRWWAARGRGAFADGRPIRVSGVGRIEDAYITTTNPATFAGDGVRHRYAALARRCWNARGLGDFWSHVLVAEGAVDIAVELPVRAWGREGEVSRLGRWDVAANLVIVEEAGGRLTDLDGVARIDAGEAVSSNRLLHDEVLAALRG